MADIPNIRFKGFVDAWEERKLFELATMHARIGWQNLRTSEFLDNGDYMLITGTDFEDGAINFATCYYVAKERYEQDKHIQVHNGSILITKDGTLGKVAYVQGLKMPATLNAGIFNIEIRDENETDEKYLFQYLKAPFLIEYVAQKATGGTIKHLNQNILVDFLIVIPSKQEQIKIGEYFSNLDHLITLHQRQCNETKELKKYMLQKMFPQNGKKIPEIRFAGFTDAWEQRKFGDENDLITGYPFESEKFVENGIRLVRGMNVKRGYLDFSEEICMKWDSSDGLENYLLKDDDILIQMDGALIGKSYAKIKEEQLPALLVQRVTRARAKEGIADADFMYQTIQCYFLMYIGKNKTETAVPHLSLNDIKNFNIKVPVIEEQRKIGVYFSRLDHLITLYQQKCDALQQVKKFMLQNMFPQKG